jgi:hypothetical protein
MDTVIADAMRTARELFAKAQSRWQPPGDPEGLELFLNAGSYWRAAGQHCLAGYAMTCAIHAAWGNGPQLVACVTAAMRDFKNCLDASSRESLDALVAIQKWIYLLHHLDDAKTAGYLCRSLQEEYANRLLTSFRNSPNAASYLVRGFVASTDIDEVWNPIFPEYEVSAGAEQLGSGKLTISLPSAFMLFIAVGDYHGAQRVVELCPDEFDTPGLKGWQLATRGFLNPEDSPELFAQAACEFADDTLLSFSELRKGRVWSSINVDLWCKYFRARASLARTVREQDRVNELIKSAAAVLEGVDSGLVNPQVSQFRILVTALVEIIDGEPVAAVRKAREQLTRESRRSGQHGDDEIILEFLDLTTRALDDFRESPARAVTKGHLPLALKTLGQIPFVGTRVAEAVAPAIGDRAMAEILGPVKTSVHRTLENINEESRLRKIILRLAQASLPRYAQVRHGPLEYGKDVVVLLDEGERRLLRMYQAKCGEITKQKWREAQSELEEMFLVPLSNFQLNEAVDLREGILICNGHANAHVEPVMEQWFEEQKRVHGWKLRFMHLDDLVSWIVGGRLVNEFKAALDEIGIQQP